MTAAIALRLEQWFGVEAAFWMNLQNRNERDLASDRTGGKIKLTDHCRSSPSSVQAFEP
jgi:plasmid maintenance system antidote protein VapI